MKIYIDGKFHDRGEARISVFDHGLLYGDGVFEGIRIYNRKVLPQPTEHIDRLCDIAKAILLDIPMQQTEMEQAVLETVIINAKVDGYIRLIVTRGEGALGLDPMSCEKPSVIIIAGDIQLYPQEYYENGIAIITAATRRMPADSLDPRIKSLNYLNNIMAKVEAKQGRMSRSRHAKSRRDMFPNALPTTSSLSAARHFLRLLPITVRSTASQGLR